MLHLVAAHCFLIRKGAVYVPDGSDCCLRFFFSSFCAFLASLDAAFKAAFSLVLDMLIICCAGNKRCPPNCICDLL